MAETRISGGRHQRCSAEEWREIFERRAASGLSMATFCQREGIAKSSYERRRTQLAHAARDAGAALSPTGVGFVDAGVLAQHATGDTAERINNRGQTTIISRVKWIPCSARGIKPCPADPA